MRPQVTAVVLDGTNAVDVLIEDGTSVLEVIPGGTTTINVRLGEGNPVLPLTNGTGYSTPMALPDKLGHMVMRLTASVATTATVIEWR